MPEKEQKHVDLELRWNADVGLWDLMHGDFVAKRFLLRNCQKEYVVAAAAAFCVGYSKKFGPVELVIKNKDGKIAKGGGAKRSYGCESPAKG